MFRHSLKTASNQVKTSPRAAPSTTASEPQASGLATCADSLSAIRQLVFEQQRFKGSELLQAVKDNWKDHDILYAIVNSSKVHHYGNDDDYADELFRYMFECYCRNISGRATVRGGQFNPGVYSVSANVGMGLNTNASLDGRTAGEAISDNLGPGAYRRRLPRHLRSRQLWQTPLQRLTTASHLTAPC